MEGVITSSPGPISRAFNKRCMPAVAEYNATARPALEYSQKACSNSAVLGPVVIQPDLKTSATASISDSLMEGLENGKKLDLISFLSLISISQIILIQLYIH
jgi:hypothetical protein